MEEDRKRWEEIEKRWEQRWDEDRRRRDEDERCWDEDRRRCDARVERLEAEIFGQDVRRMVLLRTNCLSRIIDKLYKGQSKGSVASEDPEHSSNRRIGAAQLIYRGREKFRREHPDLDESSFRLIRDFGTVSNTLFSIFAAHFHTKTSDSM